MSGATRLAILFSLVLVASLVGTSCYTVLRHPRSDTLVYENTGARRPCLDCHEDSRFYHDTFDPNHYGFGSYLLYPAWSDYYYRPWWYEDHWYGDYEAVPLDPGQHVWTDPGRRSLGTGAPPVFGGGSGSSTGSPPAGATSGQAGGSDRTAEEPEPAPERPTPTHRSTGRRTIGTSSPAPKEAPDPAPETPADPEKPPR